MRLLKFMEQLPNSPEFTPEPLPMISRFNITQTPIRRVVLQYKKIIDGKKLKFQAKKTGAQTYD